MQPFNWPRAHNLSPHLTAEDFPTFVKSVPLQHQPEEIIHLKPGAAHDNFPTPCEKSSHGRGSFVRYLFDSRFEQQCLIIHMD